MKGGKTVTRDENGTKVSYQTRSGAIVRVAKGSGGARSVMLYEQNQPQLFTFEEQDDPVVLNTGYQLTHMVGTGDDARDGRMLQFEPGDNLPELVPADELKLD